MSRNDGNKERRQGIKKMARTMENIAKNEALLEESADELTPSQLKEIRAGQSNKKRYLKEALNTIKNNGPIQWSD